MTFTPDESAALDAVLHQHRSPGVRAEEPAGNGEGRACSRATRVRRSRCAGCFSTSSPRRWPGAGTAAERRRRLASAPTSCTPGSSANTATIRWPSSGSAHLACEGVSNILTKVLEWGRLMAYLEQSTRYVPYTDRPNGRWKYHVPAELDGSPLRARVRPHARSGVRRLRAVDSGARSALSREVSEGSGRLRRRSTDRSSAPRRSTRCAACCRRPRSPTSVCSAPARRYEALLLRMFAHPLAGGPRRTRGRCSPSCGRSSPRS